MNILKALQILMQYSQYLAYLPFVFHVIAAIQTVEKPGVSGADKLAAAKAIIAEAEADFPTTFKPDHTDALVNALVALLNALGLLPK